MAQDIKYLYAKAKQPPHTEFIGEVVEVIDKR